MDSQSDNGETKSGSVITAVTVSLSSGGKEMKREAIYERVVIRKFLIWYEELTHREREIFEMTLGKIIKHLKIHE